MICKTISKILILIATVAILVVWHVIERYCL
jgi:hypothetical protein